MNRAATVGAVMVVRNERELLQDNIMYHLQHGFDAIAVLDHCSDDGSRKLLKQIARDRRVVVLHDDCAVFDHARLANAALRELLDRFDVRWVMPLDADEFFVAPGGASGLVARLESMGLRYATIGWLTALPGWMRGEVAPSLVTTEFYIQRSERPWQHEGLFRKAICAVHGSMEIVVGGHYFRREVNPNFFSGKHWEPTLLPFCEAKLLHFEFRSSLDQLMEKWGRLADHEADSTSPTDAPWLERIETIRQYVSQWRNNPSQSREFWTSVPRTFWGNPLHSSFILTSPEVAEWYAARGCGYKDPTNGISRA